MPRLVTLDAAPVNTGAALREQRDALLREADRHRYRLHRMPDLRDDLKRVTTELLRQELAASKRLTLHAGPHPTPHPEPHPKPLGDAGAVGGQFRTCIPYKD
ncbi:hypothetical protein [Roseibium sp.]|uniref:hypothetical protein n=1 Tax=Roseibium sp. TaxID=1936156 RepID=UPI003264ACA5